MYRSLGVGNPVGRAAEGTADNPRRLEGNEQQGQD